MQSVKSVDNIVPHCSVVAFESKELRQHQPHSITKEKRMREGTEQRETEDTFFFLLFFQATIVDEKGKNSF